MNKKISALFLLGFSFLFGATSVNAEETTKGLHGCYTAVRGHLESVFISETQQLGTYRIVFKNKNWALLSDEEQSYTYKRFVAAGPILGTITGADETGNVYLNHVISDKQRRGLLTSQNDIFTPTALPEDCNIDGASASILSGTETISIVAGTGIFAGLDTQQEASVTMEGTVNGCTRQNDFEVINGQLCF